MPMITVAHWLNKPYPPGITRPPPARPPTSGHWHTTKNDLPEHALLSGPALQGGRHRPPRGMCVLNVVALSSAQNSVFRKSIKLKPGSGIKDIERTPMSSSPVAVVVTQLLCTVAETRERVKTGRAGENQYSRLVRLKKNIYKRVDLLTSCCRRRKVGTVAAKWWTLWRTFERRKINVLILERPGESGCPLLLHYWGTKWG